MKTLPLPPTAVDLDAILYLEEAAAWLRMSKQELSRKAKAGIIPCIYLSPRNMRFHPRTILKKFEPREAPVITQ